MKKTLLYLVILASSVGAIAQSNQSVWSEITESKITISGKREIIPEKYKTYHLDLLSLKNTLLSAPNDKDVAINNSTTIVNLPMPNGQIQQFKVVESPVMDIALQLSFPTIKTYSIKGIDDEYANGKIDVTEFGFHGMIRTTKGDIFIDPYCQKNIEDYITYYTNDFIKPFNERGTCQGIIDEAGLNNKISAPSALICAGPNLRTYRLAVACTGEYAVAATGLPTPTKAQTLAKVVISVNRVDGVYETEVAVRLVLVPTTTLVLYIVPNTGFTTAENNNATTLITKSQSIITTNIGTANFDIGHTFSTGGGGLANLGCVCNATTKASGITGSPSPVGDAYDIDYVAHEMGHQFSGNHTFRAATGSCSGNGNLSTSVEPGSGVSIMAYAGICTATNDLDPHSIAYFHAVSYDEIMNFTNVGGGNSCKVLTASGNNAPVVAGLTAYTIPANTPFILTGSATDPDVGDVLTYQWEEFDAGTTFGNWNSGAKPFFRSYNPVTSTSRMFPTLAVVLSGSLQATIGEYTPTTAQTLKFRFTARDNKMGGGGVCSATTIVTVNGTGPFAVTSQSTTGIVYPSGSSQAISWSVAGTSGAPINCANVNIYVSSDAGLTFTLALASTPNDGLETITMPNLIVSSTTCRVKVAAVGNIFFDLNDKNFTISAVTGLNSFAGVNAIGLQLYPNPFSSTVKIDISHNSNLIAEKTVINVYDIIGNIVRTETIKLSENFSKDFDFSDLANGSYIIEVTDGKQKAVARLIKM